MAYIGRAPTSGTFLKQDITSDGSTTTFTLQNTVGNESALLVSVGGVIQEPKVAYTLATGGTQIVFSTAPSATDNVYIHFLGNSVTQNLNNVRGSEFILDADGDTSFTADTDDEIDIQVGGTDRSTIKTTGFHNIDSYKFVAGTGDDLEIYHDGTNSFIANKTGALKLATETSGIAITIGHTTSEVTIADNATIAGNLTVTGTLTQTGTQTFDGGIDVDNFNINGTTIALSTGDMILDSAGDIILDVDGADILFKDDGTTYGSLTNTSGNLIIKSGTTTAATFAGANVTFAGTIDSGAITSTGVVTATGFTIGSAVITETELEILDGLAATTAELAVIDGGTSATATTVAAADRVVLNDNGTMVQAAVTDLDTFFSASSKTLTNKTLTSPVISTIVGSTITLDSAGDIVLDADGGDVFVKDAGTTFGSLTNTSGNLIIKSGTTTAATFAGANVTLAGTVGSGAITSTGIVTGTGFTAGSAVLAEAELELLDGLTAGTAIASKVVTTDANIDSTGMRNLTISGELDAATLDISGDADIDGTTNLDIVDIDGAVDMASTLQVDGAITTSDGMVITTADVNPQLTIISTEAGGDVAPLIDLYRNSSSPADGDVLGQLRYYGENSADEKIEYVRVRAGISDVTDGTEDSNYTITTFTGGSQFGRLNIQPTETVFNENSTDVDFRIESNGSANCLFVDSGENRVGIGTNAPANTLHVKSTGDPSGDVRLILETSATDGDASIDFYRSDGNIEANILYDTDDDNMQFKVNSVELMRLKSNSIIFNEGSADIDFRIESNGDANMLFVNGGTDRVGIKTNAPTKTLGIGGDGMISLEGGSNALTFYDSSALKVYLTSQSFGDHNGDGLGLVTSGDEPHKFFTNGVERLRIEGNGKITTGGEAAGDVSDGGGLGLSQGGSDGKILTFKSSDIAHGMIDFDETDTYAAFNKYNASEGGLGVTGYSESASPGINLYGAITTADTGTAHTDEAPVRVIGALRNGQAVTNFGANDNLFTIMNNTNNQVIVKGDGEIFSNQTATVGVFDTYEDAQLVRAYDLSQGKYKAGLIDSKFDKFVQYNAKDLADANLIGKEKDGTPNSFVNITGMQRLHNGAIWQQYEATQKLTQAMYELAKETLGEEKAKTILDKHEVKLLN